MEGNIKANMLATRSLGALRALTLSFERSGPVTHAGKGRPPGPNRLLF